MRAYDATLSARGRDLELGGFALKSSALATIQKSAASTQRTVKPWESSRSSCRSVFWPGVSESIQPPPALRAGARDAGRWPRRLEKAADAGVRGLIPRGTLFDHYVHDPVEPRRSGMYEFCIVGIDIPPSGPPQYYAWEPSGHFDRMFSAYDLDRKLAMERFGRSVNLEGRMHVDLQSAHRKEGTGMDASVKWPDSSTLDSLMCGRLLPDLDDFGRPVLPPGSRFPPRNSSDILQPMLFRLKHFYRPAPGEQQRVWVLDGTGRFAAQVRDTFPEAQVEAIDDPPKFRREALKLFRDRTHLPISSSGVKLRSGPVLPVGDREVDVVILPFVCHRLCGADVEHYLRLIREACRVAKRFVVLSEDVVSAIFDESSVQRYKAFLHGELHARVLADSELHAGVVPDHFLSESGQQDCSRRTLLIQVSGNSSEAVEDMSLSLRLRAQRRLMEHD